jgi:hypothetical protein
MKDNSLRLVLSKVIELLNHTNIPQEDKVELMLNFMEFLDTKKYRENIKQEGYVKDVRIK